jgi:hypothetical protein
MAYSALRQCIAFCQLQSDLWDLGLCIHSVHNSQVRQVGYGKIRREAKLTPSQCSLGFISLLVLLRVSEVLICNNLCNKEWNVRINLRHVNSISLVGINHCWVSDCLIARIGMCHTVPIYQRVYQTFIHARRSASCGKSDVATPAYSAGIAQLRLSELADRNVHRPYPQQ